MDKQFWRQRWGDFSSNVFSYACQSKNAPENVQMPFQQRMHIFRYYLVVCTFLKKEIKKYAQNPEREATHLGLDLDFIFYEIMTDFLLNSNLPAFEGSLDEMKAENQILMNKLEAIEFDETNDDTNVNNYNIDFEAIDLAYNFAVQNIPLDPFSGNSEDAPLLFNDDMLAALEEEFLAQENERVALDERSEEKVHEDIQRLVQEMKATGGIGVWHQVDAEGNISVFHADSKNN